jgi:hypothetical protein
MIRGRSRRRGTFLTGGKESLHPQAYTKEWSIGPQIPLKWFYISTLMEDLHSVTEATDTWKDDYLGRFYLRRIRYIGYVPTIPLNGIAD